MKKIFAFLLAFVLLAGGAAAEGQMSLLALNVGKADALLLSYEDCIYLIDTGTPESWGRVSAALRVLEIDHLTGVIATHTDRDHAGALSAIASSSIAVDGWYSAAWYTGVKEKKHPALLAAAQRGETVTWLQTGDTLPFGSGSLRVLGPTGEEEKENNNSVVLLAEAEGTRFLLAGDMEFPEEYNLLDAGLIPACQVLKVGNHGNGDATSQELVAAVQPQIAVISTNTAEKPDSPANRVLKLLRGAGADIWQTQDTELGVLVSAQGGSITPAAVALPELPEPVEGVKISDKSVAQDVITLWNGSKEPRDISGWYLFSERGNELFVFPAGTVMQPGEIISVSSLGSEMEGNFVWQESRVWNKSKSDPAFLYDAYGRLMDTDGE